MTPRALAMLPIQRRRLRFNLSTSAGVAGRAAATVLAVGEAPPWVRAPPPSWAGAAAEPRPPPGRLRPERPPRERIRQEQLRRARPRRARPRRERLRQARPRRRGFGGRGFGRSSGGGGGRLTQEIQRPAGGAVRRSLRRADAGVLLEFCLRELDGGFQEQLLRRLDPPLVDLGLGLRVAPISPSRFSIAWAVSSRFIPNRVAKKPTSACSEAAGRSPPSTSWSGAGSGSRVAGPGAAGRIRRASARR